MAALALRREERIGLIAAIAFHAALLALLVVRLPGATVLRPPQRIEVTLTNDIGLKSTSPHPHVDAAPDVAPQMGESLPPPPAQPTATPEPKAEPSPAQSVVRQEHETLAKPKPTPRATSHPAPKRAEHVAASHSQPKPRASAKPAHKTSEHSGGSRIGKNFLKGISGGEARGKMGSPAEEVGPQVRAALAGEVARQLKLHWQQPNGVDVDKLATTIEWSLKPDGTLDGAPRFVSQTGVDSANRAQAKLHIEMAIRAVRLTAPFKLPQELYFAWRHLKFTFDWKLTQ